MAAIIQEIIQTFANKCIYDIVLANLKLIDVLGKNIEVV